MIRGMCGRFYIPRKAIENALDGLPDEVRAKALESIRQWIADENKPKFDVRPTNQYPVITATGVAPMRWGFRTDKSNAVFNARKESLRYPIWRESLALRRGLAVVGGFYEWTGPKKQRLPHAITRADETPLLFGTLWADDDELGPCFSIITTPATEWMQPLHNRMPLILDPQQAATWIDLTQQPKAIKDLIEPHTGELTEFPCQSPKHNQPPTPTKSELF
jgi:putative SOS response-associated peptidase YedK